MAINNIAFVIKTLLSANRLSIKTAGQLEFCHHESSMSAKNAPDLNDKFSLLHVALDGCECARAWSGKGELQLSENDSSNAQRAQGLL